MRAFMYVNQILIFNSLLAVRQRQKLHVSAFQLLAVQFVAELTVSRLKRMTPGVFPENDAAAGNTDGIGRHNFVRHGSFQHAVLVDSRFMSERIVTDDSLGYLD